MSFPKGLKILIAGEGSGGVRLIQSLLKTDYRVVGVLASPDDPSFTSTWNFAKNANIRAFESKKVKDDTFAHILQREKVDLLFSIRFPCIFNKNVLTAPTFGTYNLHTGPLPKYAGLNAISWALYNGESQYGVTLHKIDTTIDTGPIVSQAFFDILANDSALSLTQRCIEFGIPMILQFINNISHGIPVHLTKQDHQQRKYYCKEIPLAGYIDWNASAQQISNFVRACDFHPFPSPWGAPMAIYGDEVVKVYKGHPANACCDERPGAIRIKNPNQVEVATGDGWFVLEYISYQGTCTDPYLVLHNNSCFSVSTDNFST